MSLKSFVKKESTDIVKTDSNSTTYKKRFAKNLLKFRILFDIKKEDLSAITGISNYRLNQMELTQKITNSEYLALRLAYDTILMNCVFNKMLGYGNVDKKQTDYLSDFVDEVQNIVCKY